MLNWANRFSIFCLLDNQQYDFQQPSFECLLAAGCKRNISVSFTNAFSKLAAFAEKEKGQWLFGHFGYDLKNDIENLHSANADGTGFSDAHFFVPEYVVKLDRDSVEIDGTDEEAAAIYEAIQNQSAVSRVSGTKAIIKSRMDRGDYIARVKQLQQHILYGDCYEVNFCQEFYAEHAVVNPLQLYAQLATVSPNPFAALYKVDGCYCICASPERYLKKKGSRILSQPIKGTSSRDLQNEAADLANRDFLLQNLKEKSENVMVVDLVRNDLSKICKEGSVQVDELFGLYSFPQVHQMISTVSGELEAGKTWVDAVKATFPMGSMTGAPKKRVMELIEQYETTRRGLFSGALGYVEAAGDFDFNVVIRSIFYNETTGYLSFQAGSAITFYSDAEQEYEECLLKAAAIKKVLA